MNPTGFILLDKHADISSFLCVAKIRRLAGKKIKGGHAGTLDPFAPGLLIIPVSREATRELQNLFGLTKEYIATGKLGELTDSYDNTGEITQKCDWQKITQADLQSAIAKLGKKYTQKPPLYSAKKFEGKRLYQIARKNNTSDEEIQKILEKKSKEVTLHEIELLSFEPPYFTIRAHVSHGTYIRSLMNDIAKNAGSCATTTQLRRTKIGKYSVENAVGFDKLQSHEDLLNNLISVDSFLQK